MSEARHNPGREGEGGWKQAIIGLLSVGLLIRLTLVLRGGQYFWPDESRYLAARAALAGMKQGGVWSGITALLGQGDHVGFKLMGLGPAVLERWVGTQDLRLAAACFTLFSWTGLVWLWLWARRIGASPEAQFWTVLLAVTSTSLTFYTRHLLPYDASLALALAALWVGAKERAGVGRLLLAGVLTGAAALVYFGYWLLAGVTLGLVALGQNETWRRCIGRGALAGMGFAAVLIAAWLARRSRVTLRFNGKVVLDREIKETPVPPAPVAFGKNPVGGSWVGEKFTGRLLQGMRLPLDAP